MKQMKLLESSYDNVIKADYDLYSGKLSELKQLALSWYEGIELKDFDRELRYYTLIDQDNTREMKSSGVVCNFFFAYKESERFYLIDGFNRLFTDYGDIGIDQTVYVKVITTEFADHELMLTMYRLNMWKLYNSSYSYGGFSVHNFLDRGFKLLLYSKFGITLYKRGDYDKRTRQDDDIDVLDYYFRNENEGTGEFKTSYKGVKILMENENVINDFKAVIDGNNYLVNPFKNYTLFLQGFAMYLAFLRFCGNNTAYRFDYFLEKLYADKAFFKKLQGMSGTDSTRKNIYHFYRGLKLDNQGS